MECYLECSLKNGKWRLYSETGKLLGCYDDYSTAKRFCDVFNKKTKVVNQKVGFFSENQRKMAYKYTAGQLKKMYKLSEKDLKIVAEKGNEKYLEKVMERHRDVEYAMLFQKTPEFKKRG